MREILHKVGEGLRRRGLGPHQLLVGLRGFRTGQNVWVLDFGCRGFRWLMSYDFGYGLDHGLD